MTNKHEAVMQNEVVTAFMEQPHLPARFFEGTFGRGGHARLLLDKFPKCHVTTCDRDEQAVRFAHENFKVEIATGRFKIYHEDFKKIFSGEKSEIDKANAEDLGLFDGVLLDLGVSSPQLDTAERGFSFMQDGPLDMRMDRTQSLTAAELVNEAGEKELSDIFFQFGEVRKPNRVVRAIVHDRETTPFTTTLQLASLISRVERAGGRVSRRIHPATPYFQALRIAVNQELEGLEHFFENLHLHLEPGSRVVVISFHSLEDRIVKWVFRKMHKKFGHIVNKKIIIPTDEEVKVNPRSRSAKMRIFEMGGLT